MTSTPNNPNSQPLPTPQIEYSDGEREFLDIHKVDAWRKHQHDILRSLRDADPNFMDGAYVQVFQDNVDDSLDDYLEKQGLDKNAPGYGRLREIYRNASLDKIRDEQWYTSPAARNEDPANTTSERDLAIGAIQSELATAPTPEQETPAEQFKRVREAKLKAYVARLKGPVFLRPGLRKELRAAYENAQQQYEAALDELTKKEVAEWTDAGKTSAEIEQLIADSTNGRFRDDVEAQRQLLIKESGLIGQWLDKYANLSRGKKIGVTIGLGAVGLGLGFTAGLLAGAAGAVVGTAVATSASMAGMKAFGAARIYKLRQADLFKKQADLPTFDVANLGDGTNTPTTEGVRRHALDFLKNESNEQLKRGEKIKKRAVYWTLGSVAVGGAAGAVVHGAMAGEGWGVHIEGGWLQHWIEQSQNHSNSTGNNPGTSETPGTGTDAPYSPEGRAPWPQPPDTLPPTDGGGAGKTHGEIINDYIREHAAAGKIDNGEGWDQTMKELGIKSSDWHEVLQKVGPKLHEIRYGGVRAAYWDAEHHEWRINMTENHKMSPEALKLLVEEADKEDALKHSLDAAAPGSVTTPEVGAETGGVKLWQGAAPEQVLQKAYPGLTGRQALVDINELYDKLGSKNVFEHITLSEHGDNNIWIDQGTGTAKLTAEAQDLWNQMHPEEKAVAQVIAEGRSSSVNVLTHGERWTNVIDKLKQAGVTDVPKEKYGSILRQLWPQIKDLEYGDGTRVADLDRHGNLIVNESPTNILHPEALKRLVRLLYKNNYDLAA